MENVTSFLGLSGTLLSLIACFTLFCLWAQLVPLSFQCHLYEGDQLAFFIVVVIATAVVGLFTMVYSYIHFNEVIGAADEYKPLSTHSLEDQCCHTRCTGAKFWTSVFYGFLVSCIGVSTVLFGFSYKDSPSPTTPQCSELFTAGFGLLFALLLVILLLIMIRSCYLPDSEQKRKMKKESNI